MRPRWLHLLLFALFLVATAAALRFALATVVGIAAGALILAARLLWFLYRLGETCTILLWSLSGDLTDRFAAYRQARAADREARHATRLL